MAGQAWMKWFVGDWLRDPAVSALSPATRGIWFDALCCMDDLDTYKLTGTARQWITWCRCTPDEFSTAVDELREWDVCEVITSGNVTDGHSLSRANVTLVSRRRKRLHETRESARIRKQKQRERDGDSDTSQECHAEMSHTVTPTHARARADSDSDSDSQKKKDKVQPAAAGTREDDSPHVAAYIRLTGYRPPLVHQDLMAQLLRKYPVELWAAHVTVWCDTPQWNERNAKRVMDSFLEASAKDVQQLTPATVDRPAAPCISCNQKPRTHGPWCKECSLENG